MKTKMTKQIITEQHSDCRRKFQLISATLISLIVLSIYVMTQQQQQPVVECSIGYFEHYGWPTYGIVKPFWMTPFSAFPSRAISGYSRKHTMSNGRGVLRHYR